MLLSVVECAYLCPVLQNFISGFSCCYSVNEDVADYLKNRNDDSTRAPIYTTEKSVLDTFEGYDDDDELDAKIDAMSDEELDEYIKQVDGAFPDHQEESSFDEVNDGRSVDTPVPDASLGETDLAPESSVEEGSQEESWASDESAADGLSDYTDTLENIAQNKTSDDSASLYNTDNDNDYVPAVVPTNESVADGFEDYIEELDDNAREQFEGIEESEPTDESVADGFEDYIEDLDAKEQEENEVYGDIQETADVAYNNDQGELDSASISMDSSLNDTNEGSAPPPTPDMQERVDLTESHLISSTDSSVDNTNELAEITDGDNNLDTDNVEKALEPIDDELMEELEDLTSIPNEKELVDNYINNNEGSLEDFDLPVDSSDSDDIPNPIDTSDGLISSVQETTQDLGNDSQSDNTDPEPVDVSTDYDDSTSFDGFDDGSHQSIVEEEPMSTNEEEQHDADDYDTHDDETATPVELNPVTGLLPTADNQQDDSEGLVPSVQKTTSDLDSPAESETAEVDTESIVEDQQSAEESNDSYDRESSFNPINYEDSGDDSPAVVVYPGQVIDEDTETYEPPSEYGSQIYSDGPTYGVVEDIEDVQHEIEEVKFLYFHVFHF